MAIDYSARYNDYARFLPAISEMFARYVAGPDEKRPLPCDLSDLDFLNPDTKLFYLPCALYSAGQAAKSSGASKRKDMVTGRTNTGTTILGDSGGFQIQQGSIKFKGDETRDRMLRWLEENCDWSMILDFPTGGINMNTIKPHTKRLIDDGDTLVLEWSEFEKDKTGTIKRDKDGKRKVKRVNSPKPLNLIEFAEQMDFDMNNYQEQGFATCLFQTLINNDYFIKHRVPGATKFLNVVQGRNIEESNAWYERVKHYEFEGWSLAGPHKEKFDMTLTRLLSMRRDGLLENKNWMHILGVGKLANGCAYTTMQRMIRKHDNPDFTISYDVSSPFTTAAYGNLFMGYSLDKSGWTVQSDKLDGREFLVEYEQLVKNKSTQIIRKNEHGKDYVVPYRGEENFLDILKENWKAKTKRQPSAVFVETELGKLLKMKDICVNTDPKLASTWDTVTYALMMHHNVQVHLEGVFEAQDLYDRGDVDKVPYELLLLKEVIEEILDPATTNPESLIQKHRKVLHCLVADNTAAGVIVDNIFDISEEQSTMELEVVKNENILKLVEDIFH